MSDAVFRYASTAIGVGNLTALSVTHSEFSNNDAAFQVQATTDSAPTLGALPCVPPYLSFVAAQGDWFGTTGIPGTSVDVSSFAHARNPEVLQPIPTAMESLINTYIRVPVLTDNTIPWSLYTCPIPATKRTFSYVETPIDFFPLATRPPFPQFAQRSASN